MAERGIVQSSTATQARIKIPSRGGTQVYKADIWWTVGLSPSITGITSAHTHTITRAPLDVGDEVLVVTVDGSDRLAVIATR